MTHKITAFYLKSIRKSYKSILNSYKNTIMGTKKAPKRSFCFCCDLAV